MSLTKSKTEGKISLSRHTLVRPKRFDSQACGQAVVPQSLGKRQRSSRNILVVKTQSDSMLRAYGSPSLSRCPSYASQHSNRSNVSFQTVMVREYPRCIGDNPSVSSGPPLSIEWEPQKFEEISIDDFEESRASKNSTKCEKITSRGRVDILQNECQASLSSIMRASYDMKCVREQRLETMKQTKRQQRIEEALESTRRNLGKLSFKKLKRVESSDKMPSKRKKVSSSRLFRSVSSKDAMDNLDKNNHRHGFLPK
jgi:hypothetical protein